MLLGNPFSAKLKRMSCAKENFIICGESGHFINKILVIIIEKMMIIGTYFNYGFSIKDCIDESFND